MLWQSACTRGKHCEPCDLLQDRDGTLLCSTYVGNRQLFTLLRIPAENIWSIGHVIPLSSHVRMPKPLTSYAKIYIFPYGQAWIFKYTGLLVSPLWSVDGNEFRLWRESMELLKMGMCRCADLHGWKHGKYGLHLCSDCESDLLVLAQ